MSSTPWIMAVVAVLVALLAIVFLTLKKGKPMKTDYYTLFIIGVVWLLFGIPMEGYSFSVMGLVFMIIGLANRDKWKENHKRWKDISPKEKKIKLIMIGVLTLLLILGIVVFLFTNSKI